MKNSHEIQLGRKPLFRQMANESDRVCAIIGCCLLEEDLERTLRSRTAKGLEVNQVESLFQGYGPLSTFSAKIALCHVFGFITEAMFHDLEIIRRIRNKFAHEYGKREFFDDDTFQRLCCVRCTYPIGTPDWPGATVDKLRLTLMEFCPSNGEEPASIEMSSAKAKLV